MITTVREDGPADGPGERGPAPYLFLCLDADHPAAGGCRYDLSTVRRVELGRDGARGQTLRSEGGLPTLFIGLTDARISRAHLRLEQVMGEWIAKDLGSSNGTLVNGVRRDHAPLADGDRIELGRSFLRFRRLPAATGDDQPGAPSEPGLKTLLPGLAGELARVCRVADSPIEVLIHGESGTGKELLARQVHALSGRPGEFVPVNCGAIPRALVESELFGYQRGAFTGAVDDRAGLIRAAHRGSLFLDEISDLPPPAQTAFLRAIEHREVIPVGATRAVRADFRLIAASHHDLRQMIGDGAFRGDLYARLAGYTVELPPLRERVEDLGLLVADLLRRNAPERTESVRLSLPAARALLAHRWEHNVRELEKCLAVAVILSEGEEIDLDCLPAHIRPAPASADPGSPARRSASRLSARDLERRDRIVALLAEHEGNISEVARRMGKGRTQVRRWILRYDIDPRRLRA
jgi:transcriptional regulator of acetoin/glycerol metabolism